MSMRERLHELIAESELSDSEAEVLLGRLQTWRDPVVRRFETAPPDDEPTTPEEELAVAEAWAEHLRHPERARELAPKARARRSSS